jgi:hypothetical protein
MLPGRLALFAELLDLEGDGLTVLDAQNLLLLVHRKSRDPVLLGLLILVNGGLGPGICRGDAAALDRGGL